MEHLSKVFAGFPMQEKVAKMMLRLGVSVKEGKAYTGNIELSDAAVGRAAGADRRVARSAMDKISNDTVLSKIFGGLRPIALLADAAAHIGCSTLIVVPTNASTPGILADIAAVMLAAGVSIKQAVIDDPDGEDVHLLIVIEGTLPPEFIPSLKQCRGVDSIILR